MFPVMVQRMDCAYSLKMSTACPPCYGRNELLKIYQYCEILFYWQMWTLQILTQASSTATYRWHLLLLLLPTLTVKTHDRIAGIIFSLILIWEQVICKKQEYPEVARCEQERSYKCTCRVINVYVLTSLASSSAFTSRSCRKFSIASSISSSVTFNDSRWSTVFFIWWLKTEQSNI